MIVGSLASNYPYDPQHAYDFTPYLHDLSGISIYYGYSAFNTDQDTNIKVRFQVEHPNMLYLTNDKDGLNINKDNIQFDYIFDICPYTCNLLNEKYNTNKYIPIFFPLKEVAYTESERQYPVFYSGHRMTHIPIIKDICDVTQNRLGLTLYNALTNSISIRNISSYYTKLDIYSKTKICIVHNILTSAIPNMGAFMSDSLYKKHFPWQTNGSKYAPQIKSRIFEGAMMGCILLVFKDQYHITEQYFTENEDFLYFTDKSDLQKKIDMILSDYDKYRYLAINAKKKFYENYTFKHFVDKIITSVKKQ